MMLNEEQKRAIELIDGPCLVIAGAGTGKTKTIVEKLAFLSKSADPARILALTFSNEAAAQMKSRAVEIAPEARNMHISTFHSFCAEFIRSHARECGVPESFTIMEELDAAILLRGTGLDTGRALRYANTIGKAKDLSIRIEDYRRYLSDQENVLRTLGSKNLQNAYENAVVRLRTLHLDTVKSREELERLKSITTMFEEYTEYSRFAGSWEKYEEMKQKRNALDYADLNEIVIRYVERYGPGELSDAWDYVVVDEFQDTNKVQFTLLERIAANKKNITVVGDQNQTVYAFRGAYANNIEKFRHAFSVTDDRIVHLSVNYRSTDRILRTAHSLIKNNYETGQPVLLKSSEGAEGGPVAVIQAVDNREQARRLVEEIEKLLRDGLSYRDIAVLYRSHSSASLVKRALQRRGLPYSTVGNADFFYSTEVKTAASFLYVLNNFSNPMLQADQAWWKLLHDQFGLSGGDSTRLAEYRKRKHLPLQELLYNVRGAGLSDDGNMRVAKLLEIVDSLRKKSHTRLSDILLEIYELTGLARRYDGNREAMTNLKKLHQLATTFETFHGDDIRSFISYLELVDEMGGLQSAKPEEEETIKLMTIHAAKGLEFSAVFVVDMVKDKFPLTRGGVEPLIPMELNEQYNDVLSRNYGSEKEAAIKEFTAAIKLREERRLAYVAFTRAKQRLILMLAKDYGGKEAREPSQFLYESGAQAPWFTQDAAGSDDIVFVNDREIKAKESADTDLDRAAAVHKRLMVTAADSRDFRRAQYHMVIYQSLLEGKPVGSGPASREAEKILENIKKNMPTGMKLNPAALAFSVTSIGTFADCPKKYELKHILNMPSRDDEEGEGALGFGSVVHDVLDRAAKQRADSRQMLDGILESVMKEKRLELDTDRIKRIMDVFWIRHSASMKNILATELYFRFPMDGFLFSGKIDRIDRISDNKVRIIDYKTGYASADVSKDDRERQLLLYALALQLDPLLSKNGWIPAELVLDMLEKEKPMEFMLKNDIMSPKEGRIKPVSVGEIRKSMVETAKKIESCYERGFPVAENDFPCRFCAYKLYCPKWG